MTAARAAKAIFLIELVLLALPAMFYFVVSFASLSGASIPLGDGALTLGPDLVPMVALGLFALAFTSFAVLAVRYLAGGGEGVGRVSAVVWGLAVLGQLIAVPSTLWTGLIEDAPNTVRAVALLTFPALGLLIPLVHMLVAASLARRGRADPTPA